MRFAFIQHAVCERPGLLGDIAAARGISVQPHLVEEGRPLPSLEGVDGIVSMGSVEAAYDESIPWIRDEYVLLEKALEQEVPILGVCFGGQMLAQVLGGVAQRAPESEFGWMKVATTDPTLVPSGPWLLWHDDEFRIPSGAQLIAESDVCAQAFTYGSNLGLQFHPEATPQIVSEWLDDASSRGQRLEEKHRVALRDSQANQAVSRKNAEILFDGFLKLSGLSAPVEEVE